MEHPELHETCFTPLLPSPVGEGPGMRFSSFTGVVPQSPLTGDCAEIQLLLDTTNDQPVCR